MSALTIEMLDQPDQTEAAAARPELTPVVETETSIALRQVNTNIAEFDSVEAGLQALEAKYRGVVYPVETPKGLAEAKAARVEVREPRYATQNAVANAKTPLEQLKKAIAARGAEIVARITAIETPIDTQIKNEEKRKADEKARKEKEAAERRAAIDVTIAEIRDRVVACINQPAAFIAETIQWVDDTEVIEEDFGDRTGEALQTIKVTRERLVVMHETAVATELAAAKQKAENERLQALAADLEAREAKVRDSEAITKRIENLRLLPTLHVESDVETLKAALDDLFHLDVSAFGDRAAEATVAATSASTELDGLLATAIEEAALAEVRAKAALSAPVAAAPAPAPAPVVEAQPAAAPAPAPVEPPAPPPPVRRFTSTPARPQRPTDDAIVGALALHYRVHESTVVEWLLDMDLTAQSDRIGRLF